MQHFLYVMFLFMFIFPENDKRKYELIMLLKIEMLFREHLKKQMPLQFRSELLNGVKNEILGI